MDPLDYLHLQMRLEGKALINGCLMRQVEFVPDEELPLILIAQLANQERVMYFNEAISPPWRAQMEAGEIHFPNSDALLKILRTHNIRFEMGHYKTYVFPVQPVPDVEILRLSKDEPRVKAFGFGDFAEPVYAMEQNGSLVSACVSTRENDQCGEAWVYTDPGYRHQGFAQKVVRAWAGSLMSVGKVPFYSHRIDNVASSSLARKLGLQPVFEEISIVQLDK